MIVPVMEFSAFVKLAIQQSGFVQTERIEGVHLAHIN